MVLLLLLACGPDKAAPTNDTGEPSPTAPLTDEVLAAFDLHRVKADVDFLASDDLAGRTPGSLGHTLARDHVVAAMADIGLTPAGDDGGYEKRFTMDFDRERYALDEDGAVVPVEVSEGINLIGVLPGSDPELADEAVVVMAHYDHLGVTEGGDAYNGALDDAAGVAALLEVARLLVDQDVRLGRTLVFLITDAEEGGLNGAVAYTGDPWMALEEVSVAFSIDPLGRGLLPDYAPLVLLGLERCPELKQQVRELASITGTEVAYVNRDPIFTFASDQDPFWDSAVPVPAFWFTSPGMTWYHTVDDTSDTIDYRTIRDHGRFLASALTLFANDDARHEDLGPQELSVEDAADAVALLRGVQTSAELTDDERAELAAVEAELQSSVDAGAPQTGLQGAYLSAAVMLLLDLTQAHPGEVPPPWPE